VGEHGVPEYVIHRPAAYDFPSLASEVEYELIKSAPQWIYFGTLQQMTSQALPFTKAILRQLPHARTFYDVNLRRDSYSAELITGLLQHAAVVKLNEEEAGVLAEMLQLPRNSLEEFCRRLQRAFSVEGVCVTRGAKGCSLLAGDVFIEAPGYRVTVSDTIGAGDAFSAAFLHGIDAGWPPQQIADLANRLGALVASLPGGAPAWSQQQLEALAHPRDAT
jgi:fructokinase